MGGMATTLRGISDGRGAIAAMVVTLVVRAGVLLLAHGAGATIPPLLGLDG